MAKMYLDLPKVGRSRQQQRGQAGSDRSAWWEDQRWAPILPVCGRLTDLSRCPFDYPMTILKPVRMHSSSIKDISVVFRRPGHP